MSTFYHGPSVSPPPCGLVWPLTTVNTVGHYYRFKRGDRVTILWGFYAGATGVADSSVFQRTVDYPEAFAPGYHVVLDSGEVVTVRWDQLEGSPAL